ncbi:MAG: heavy metal translocating P-type ATPase [Paracoccaceae bacterium]
MTVACPACIAIPDMDEIGLSTGLQFSVPTIHCAACIGKIERGMQDVTGVRTARVNLSLKRLTVTGPANPEHIEAKLADLGFEAYPLDIEALSTARDTVGRTLLMRMAVAGFAMMNVMLLSVAVWSGAADTTRDLFHLISAAIALPAVAYSAQPFFQNAWVALRVRRLNMDVPISLAILLAAGMSLFETLNGGDHAYFDAALSLTFFLLIGRYMDHRTRSAAHSAAKELTALEVHTAQRITGSNTQTVAVSNLAVGDEISVPTGARVPIDGFLLSSHAVIDRSFLTGESAAVDVAQTAQLQAGEVNVGAVLRLRATAVGEDTSLRRMAQLVETAENSRNSYTALADKAAQIYAPAVHLLAFFAFFGWVIATGDVRHALNVAIAVLIITCPCALGLAVPAVSTAAISRLFSMGYLVKHATALERLAETTRVVFDKTGTLSRLSFTVPEKMPSDVRAVAKALAQSSNHPLSKELVSALSDTNAASVRDLTEIAGQGIRGAWQGHTVQLGRGAWLGADFDGLGVKIGTSRAEPFETSEAARTGAVEALNELTIPSEIITGDAEKPAQAFAAMLGIPLIANVRADEKLGRLRDMTDQSDRVLMIGDGLNDTAALAAAHASMAPATALDASRSASDIVILTDSFEDLPLVLKISKLTRHLSKQNFAIAALYNCIAIPIALAGLATPFAAALAMSASSITVLLNSQRVRYVK